MHVSGTTFGDGDAARFIVGGSRDGGAGELVVVGGVRWRDSTTQ